MTTTYFHLNKALNKLVKTTIMALFCSAAICSAAAISAHSAHAGSKMICEGNERIDIAWAMSLSAHEIFTSNLMEPVNRRYSKDQKRAAVKKAILKHHDGAGGYSPSEIARALVWASDCTGNDFKWFAAIIGNESSYCKNRKGAGGDSGCGQFTNAAIHSMKLQLKLPSRKSGDIDTASPIATKAMKEMISSCYKVYDGMVDGSEGEGNEDLFYRVMDSKISELKSVFRKASAMHVDILASAIFLKFQVALAGGYILPGTKLGGIARYNGRGTRGYLKHIIGKAKNIKVNYSCIEDTYTSSVAEFACEIDNEDPDACMNDFEYRQSEDFVELSI